MHFCLECFQRDIRVQCGHEERPLFVRNHCSIVCCMCRQHQFTDRDVLAFVDDATFAILRQACYDVVELQAYNKANSEFQSKLEEMRSELIRVQDVTERRIYRHRLYICEHILTLKCPRHGCKHAVLDFSEYVTLSAFLLASDSSFLVALLWSASARVIFVAGAWLIAVLTYCTRTST